MRLVFWHARRHTLLFLQHAGACVDGARGELASVLREATAGRSVVPGTYYETFVFASVAFLPATPTRWLLPLVVFLTPLADAPLCFRLSFVLNRCWSRHPAPPCQCVPPGLTNVLPQSAHG